MGKLSPFRAKRQVHKQTFGFRTNAPPPQSKELNPFEHEMYETIASIKHRSRKSYTPYQNKLLKCVKEIQSSDKIFILGDKTSNVYKVSKELYNKLLINNVTKDYRLVNEDLVKEINQEAKEITDQLKIADRVEQHSEAPAFITIKDHQPYKWPYNPH